MSTDPGITFTVRPPQGRTAIGFRELWEYREVVYFLAWRDVKVRYKQAIIGVAWVLLQPLAMIAIFSLLFDRVGGIATRDVPYIVFVLVGLVPWQFFSRVVSESTNSLITDQRLITRVYFPRLIVPAATAVAALVDFFISMILVGIVMMAFGVRPGSAIVFLPIPILLMVAAALGVGFWLSALNVEYRDVMHAVPFVVQLWFFATPVIYSTSLLPTRWKFLLGLNPMTVVAESFRICLLRTAVADVDTLVLSASVAVVLLVSGTIWFRIRERVFVDSLGSTGT